MSQHSDIVNYLINQYNALNEACVQSNKEMMKYHPNSSAWNEYENKWKRGRLMQDCIYAILQDNGLSYLLHSVR